MTTIISLGGSIVAPEKPDAVFIAEFVALIRNYLLRDAKQRFILIVGGGGPARLWQGAYRDVCPGGTNDAQDWIGIMATRLNAELVKACFATECLDPVVYDPTAPIQFSGTVLVAAGWKPGFSTDFDAVMLAERFGAKDVINLSNIEKVYTADPKKDPNARPLDTLSWRQFREMVGDTWEPGKNTPFDPIASEKAEALGLRVICAAGRNLRNLSQILENKAFTGTTITGA